MYSGSAMIKLACMKCGYVSDEADVIVHFSTATQQLYID